MAGGSTQGRWATGRVAPGAVRGPPPTRPKKRPALQTVREPSRRRPTFWVVSTQRKGGTAATCRGCLLKFATGQCRMALEVEHLGNKHRHYHPYCVEGGLHPDDTIRGLHCLSAEFRREIQDSTVSAEDWHPDPELPYAQIPRTVRESATGPGRGGGPASHGVTLNSFTVRPSSKSRDPYGRYTATSRLRS